MLAYNFQGRFAEAVESGEKRQTIRPRRKRPTKPGDTLYFYTGMRTKQCRKLREAFCKRVRPIEIRPGDQQIILDGSPMMFSRRMEFAQADGFWRSGQLFAFFRQHYGDPIDRELELIEW